MKTWRSNIAGRRSMDWGYRSHFRKATAPHGRTRKRVSLRLAEVIRSHVGICIRSVVALLTVAAFAIGLAGESTAGAAVAPTAIIPSVRLANSVVPAVANHEVRPVTARASDSSQSLTLTLTLNRNNESGFQAYLADVDHASSPDYHHFLTQAQLTALFGPKQSSYDAVLSWLRSNGFRLEQGSSNRLTITVKGTRAQAERAFDTSISDYSLHGRDVFSNTVDPGLPSQIAGDIESVGGLSNLATPTQPQSVASPAATNASTPDATGFPALCGAGGLAFMADGADSLWIGGCTRAERFPQ